MIWFLLISSCLFIQYFFIWQLLLIHEYTQKKELLKDCIPFYWVYRIKDYYNELL